MFETSFFADPKTLLLGAITGLVFGFLLQKGGVTRFNTIVGQFLLRDFTVLKVMFTAIVVGSVGVYLFLQFGLIGGLHLKQAALAGNFLGGAIFAVGMVILGYCPGTGIAALGDGARDAVFGVLGMLAGSAIYAEVHPWFKANVLSVADYGKVTLVTQTGASPWWFVAGLVVLAGIIFAVVERVEARAACCQKH